MVSTLGAWSILVVCLILRGPAFLQARPGRVPDTASFDSTEPEVELQSLADALEGTWSVAERYEPDKRHRDVYFAHAEETWRRGPGGFTLIQELHVNGGWVSMTLFWWDKAKGLQSMSCSNSDPAVCTMPVIDATQCKLQWDGRQLLFEKQFENKHKKLVWRELLSAITPTSFTRTTDTGELGKRMKRWVTADATRRAAESPGDSVMSASHLSPVPQMRRLFALLGTWSILLERGGTAMGEGEQSWQPGPGNLSLIGREHSADSRREVFGLGVTWWDATANSYRAVMCRNNIDSGCIPLPTLTRWEADDFVLAGEADHDGKPFAFREVFSEITPVTFKISRYQGETASRFEPALILHATKRAEFTVTRVPPAGPRPPM